MRLVCGLGNPGPEYDDNRHNVGWWVLDRLAVEWSTGPFRRSGDVLTTRASRGDEAVSLIKPLTYMNRSGAALARLIDSERIDPRTDLLVVVDDAALDVGRLRLRAGGSAGGHNGLKSIERVLGSQEYPRLRIGVGSPPPGQDLADWVLSPLPPEDEKRVLALLPEAVAMIGAWVEEGIEAAMDRHNR